MAWNESDPWSHGTMQVSNMNRIRHSNGHVYEASITTAGYRTISIGKEIFTFHRVIAWLTHGDPPPNAQVNHRDKDRSNCTPENLEYTAARENIRHCLDDPNHGTYNRKGGVVICYRRVGTDQWTEVTGHKAATAETGVSSCEIVRQLSGGTKHVRGYEFMVPPLVDLPGEEWRELAEPRVRVSNMGRLETVPKGGKWAKRPQRSTPSPMRGGYAHVTVDKKNYVFHRLVLVAFVGPPPSPTSQADHIDSDRSNNQLSNLQWLSRSENCKKRGPQSVFHAANRGVVIECESATKRFKSSAAAAKELGLTQSRVQSLCRDKRTKDGMRFSYQVLPPLPGEVFRTIALADVAHIKQKRQPHAEIVPV